MLDDISSSGEGSPPGTPHDSYGSRPPQFQGSPVRSESVPPIAWRWLSAALDELDYGIVVLFEGLTVVHMNVAARAAIVAGHALTLVGRELRARRDCDAAALRRAIAAAQRGLRGLLGLGGDGDRASVSVIPLDDDDRPARAVLVVFGKQAMCESLSMQGFARVFQLTSAETRVLVGLCNGVAPPLLAHQLGVAISTVRTQISSIRLKTGAQSIRALVEQVAVLPPIKGMLGRNAVHPAANDAAVCGLPACAVLESRGPLRRRR